MTKGKIVSILCVVMLVISGALLWIFNPFKKPGEKASLKEMLNAASSKIEETVDSMIDVANAKADENTALGTARISLNSSKLENFVDTDKYNYLTQSMRAVEGMVNMTNYLVNNVSTENGYDLDFQYNVVYKTELEYIGKIYLTCQETNNGVQVLVDTEGSSELVNIVIEYNSKDKLIEKVLLSSGSVGTFRFNVVVYDALKNEINFIYIYEPEHTTTNAEDVEVYRKYSAGELSIEELLEINLNCCYLLSSNVTDNPEDLVINYAEYIKDAEGNVASDEVTQLYNKIMEETKISPIRTAPIDKTNAVNLDAVGKAYIKSMNMATIEAIEYEDKVYFMRTYIPYRQMVRNLTDVKELINNDSYTAEQKGIIDIALNYLETAGEAEYLGGFNTIDGSSSLHMSVDRTVDLSSSEIKFVAEVSIYENYSVAHVTYKLVDSEVTEIINE